MAMATPRCSKGFVKETSSYSRSYSNKNSGDGMAAYSCTNGTKASINTVCENSIPNSVSVKWPPSKSSQVLKACSEDFPTLSSSFSSSCKSNKGNSDVLPGNIKPSFVSYSDKLQNNKKSNTNHYFKNIVTSYSKDSNQKTEDIYKRNTAQSSSPSDRDQAFNENTHAANLPYNNVVKQLSKVKSDKCGNVIENSSTERPKKLTIQKCDKGKTVSHKSSAELGDEHHKNKSPSYALSNESSLNITQQNLSSKSPEWKKYNNRKKKSSSSESQEQHCTKTSDKPLNYDSSLNNKKTSNFEQHTTNWCTKEQRKHKENDPYKDNSVRMTSASNSQDFRNSNGAKGNTALKPNSQNSSMLSKYEPEIPKKHKKKRPSKVKRQTAFQTGKLLVLSSEFHSRIVQNLTNSESNVSNNEVVDIDNLSEYPSLSVMAKVSKPALPQPQLSQQLNPITRIKPQASSLELKTNENCEGHESIIKNEKIPSESREPPPAVCPEDTAIEKIKEEKDIPWDDSHSKVKQCPREPIQLFDILTVTKPKEKLKKKIEVIPKSEQDPKVEKPVKVKATSQAPNTLDSSAPIKRGKEREHPKQKKVTPLKKIILSERLKKKELYIPSIESCASKDSETNIEIGVCSKLNDGEEDVLSSIYEAVKEKLHANSLEFAFIKPGETLERENIELSDQLLKLELVADTAEAIVDKVVELAVTKVRTMGLNVNAACFESSSLSVNETECVINDSSFHFDQSPYYFENSTILPCHFQNSTIIPSHFQNATILPPENLSYALISNETNYHYEYPNCETEFTEINTQAVIETCTATSEEVEESEKIIYPDWSEDERNLAIQTVVHMKIFREYCTHLLSKELNEAVILLIDTLAGFQDRQHHKDPVKARMKRRLISGIKEVKKYLKLKKLKCVIMAPNLEDIKAEGGLNAELADIIKTAKEFHIPCIFAADRKQLGRACHKSVPVSCLGIFRYEGSEAYYKHIMELYETHKKDYQALVKIVNSHITDENIKEIIEVKEQKDTVLVNKVRSKVLQLILLKENRNPELPTKYNADVLKWFLMNYHLRII